MQPELVLCPQLGTRRQSGWRSHHWPGHRRPQQECQSRWSSFKHYAFHCPGQDPLPAANGICDITLHSIHHVHVSHLTGPLCCHQDTPAILTAVWEGDGSWSLAGSVDHFTHHGIYARWETEMINQCVWNMQRTVLFCNLWNKRHM